MSLTKVIGALFTPHTPGLDINANVSPRVVAVSVVLIVITAVTVTLRFVSRWVSKAGMWWDDWMILAAMVWAKTPYFQRVEFGLTAVVCSLGLPNPGDIL